MHASPAPPAVMAGLGPAIHVFAVPREESRGWPAFADHDGGGTGESFIAIPGIGLRAFCVSVVNLLAALLIPSPAILPDTPPGSADSAAIPTRCRIAPPARSATH